MNCRVLFLSFILLISAAPSTAQVYSFDHYTSKEGLLSDYVLDICADSRGYLWVGTNDGLSQYNGDTFRNYTVADGLAFSRVTCLIESKSDPGTLWIGTNGGGISKFRENKFKTYKVSSRPQSNMISCIYEDLEGRVWCGTVNGLYRLVDDTFQPYAPRTFVGSVNGVAQSTDKTMWIFASEGLFTVSTGSEMPKKYPLRMPHDADMECILPGRDSTIWVGLSDGEVMQLRRDRIVRQLRLGNGGVGYMMEDGDGYLAAASEGIYRIPGGSAKPFLCYSTANGLPENYVTSGTIDWEGNLWFGLGTKGIAKLSNRSIVTLPIRDMSFAPNGTSAAVDGNNHLWVVSAPGIWEVWMGSNRSWNRVLHNKPNTTFHRPPFTLLFDPPSSLWVGCSEGPIGCYNIEPKGDGSSSLRLTRHLERGRDFPEGAPIFLYKDREGYLWISMSENRGVYLFDFRKKRPFLRSYTTDDGLPDNSVRAMFEDRAGNYWFGGYDNGLTVLPANRKFSGGGRCFRIADGLPNMSIRTIDQDSSGTLWFGTRYGGLASYRDSVFHTVSLTEGLASTAVWSMTEGRCGHWVGTQLGFQEIAATEPISFSSKRELLGHPVYACGEIDSGWLWLITDAGVMMYDRIHDLPNTVPPPIYISSVRVNGVAIDIHRPLKFAYDQNSITVDVVGLSFRDEKGVRYQYKLTGNETDWSLPTDHHSIVFAALAPETYTFMARAINASGVASARPAEITFTIAPPLWKTWWFLTSTAILVGLVVFTFVRIRILRLLEIERIRSRIATDLHDDIGAGLTRIAILSSAAERELPRKGKSHSGKAPAAESLQKIGETARELVDSMSDVVWSLELGGEPLERLVHRLRSFAFEGCEAKGIRLRFVVDDRIFALQFTSENARHILLCAKEAVTNVVRHSVCTEAFVEFALDGETLRLTIKDNGKGFDTTKEKEGHGLSNMEKRARKNGGNFSVTSVPRKGTTIQATFHPRG